MTEDATKNESVDEEEIVSVVPTEVPVSSIDLSVFSNEELLEINEQINQHMTYLDGQILSLDEEKEADEE